MTQNLWDAAKAILRGKHNDVSLPQETRKTFSQTHQEEKGEGPNK